MRRPRAPHLVSMTWRDGLFVHWPFDPGAVRPHVPDRLELDVRDGRAWVSVLPFVLADAGLRASPSVARLTFPELNVRTYVRLDGQPGLLFLDIDVDHPVVPRVVRATTRLPVHRADATVRRERDRVTFRSRRRGDPPARFSATYRPTGEPDHAEPGSLDHWLVERRRMYAPRGPAVLYAEIAHGPWPLRPAEASVDGTVLSAAGLAEPAADPRVRYADDLPMTGSVFRRIRRG